MSIVYCSAPTFTLVNLTPRQALTKDSHLALDYITWGLIWDLKIKKEIPVEIRIASGIPEIKTGRDPN